jgi:chromosome segregation ATPase
LKANIDAFNLKNTELQQTLDTLKAANDSEKLEESIQARIEAALKEQKEQME